LGSGTVCLEDAVVTDMNDVGHFSQDFSQERGQAYHENSLLIDDCVGNDFNVR
jgi:hypothetical protein